MKADRTRRREQPEEEEAPGFAGQVKASLRAHPKAVLLTVGALVSVVTISVNALYLQPGKHPAPLFAGGSGASTPAPAASAGGADAIDELARSAQQREREPAAAPDNLVSAIQTALKSRGIYDDPVDGAMGPATRAAIAAYEEQAGLEVTGAPSVGLLASLSTPGTPQPQTQARKVPTPSKATVARLQEALVSAGYGPITVDGIYGSETAGAIRRYQLDHGLAVTGSVSEPLLARFGLAAAVPEG